MSKYKIIDKNRGFLNIGKKKISVIKLKEFEKEDMKIKDRVFRKEDAF